MQKIEIGTQEWLDKRRELITATDIPIILGVSPWCTPLELYLRKKGVLHVVQTQAMVRGLNLEPEARSAFERDIGEFVIPEFRISEKYPWLAASFDGINEYGTLVEIKCPNEKTHRKAVMENTIEEYYHWQMVGQMIVSGLSRMYYVSFRPGEKVPYMRLERKICPDDMEIVLSETKKFYNNLHANIPPGETERDIDKKVSFVVNEDFLSREASLADLMRRSDEIKKHIEELREQLISECLGETCVGTYLKFTPYECKGNIDYDSIPALKGVDKEKYRKPGRVKWMISPI